MQIQPSSTSLAQQLISHQQHQKTTERESNAKQIIEQASQRETAPQPTATERELAAIKYPQQSVLTTPLKNQRASFDSMTQRFETTYEEQVQKGRKVDIRV